MSLILPEGLPAIGQLRKEGVGLDIVERRTDARRTDEADGQGVGPDVKEVGVDVKDVRADVKEVGVDGKEVRADVGTLRIAILNLMPTKETTEEDFLRILANSPLRVEVEFMKVKSHVSRHVSPEHMERFYRDFEVMKDEDFDGLIVTGAPLEHLEYEQVDYWEELGEIFSWARARMRSTLYICWAAQAGLYYHYGIKKYPLPAKMFGIFPQKNLAPRCPLFRGFDDVFHMPHSRHTELHHEDIAGNPELKIIAESEESGVGIVYAREGREVFVTGHSEYRPGTLDSEYRRDLAKGLPIAMPRHYYEDDDPSKAPVVTWRAHGNLMINNWLAFLVNRE